VGGGRAGRRSERGRADGLSRDAVISAALRLARRVGLDGFTMRDLAAELGTTQMAAYHYVRSRGGLETLLLDEILAGVDVPPANAGSWHERLRGLTENSLAVLRSWTGSGPLLLRHRPRRKAEHIAALIAVLRDAGFTERDAVLAARLIQVWCWGELSVREYLDGKPVETGTPAAGPSKRPVARLEISEDEVTEFALDVMLEGLRARLARTTTGAGSGEHRDV